MFLEINSTLKCMKGAFPVPSRNSEKKTWSLSLLLLLLLLLLLNCFCQAGAISRSGVLTQIQDQHPCLYSGHSWFFYVIPSVPSPSIAAAAPPPLLLGHAQDTPPGFQNGMDRTLLFFFPEIQFLKRKKSLIFFSFFLTIFSFFLHCTMYTLHCSWMYTVLHTVSSPGEPPLSNPERLSNCSWGGRGGHHSTGKLWKLWTLYCIQCKPVTVNCLHYTVYSVNCLV